MTAVTDTETAAIAGATMADDGTWHIHIGGRVQGVGFRPFVYRLAVAMQLKGCVRNTGDGVHIEINGGAERAHDFYEQLLNRVPPHAAITAHRIRRAAHRAFDRFYIDASSSGGAGSMPLTPDFAMCDACRAELDDPQNRRFGYPFITCTDCGPRYSIIHTLPYDREHTSMNAFKPCEHCEAEYLDPDNRRYHSQTNSCDACGIQLELFAATGEKLQTGNHDVITFALQALTDKKIVAVKGVGGYLLLCDAADEDVVRLLRHRKQRPAKPFALLYPHIQAIANDFHLRPDEAAIMQSAAAPIVLVQPKANTVFDLCRQAIAPGLSTLGIMLPCAPLLHLLSSGFGKPLVATSGNIAGSPVIAADKDALKYLGHVADYIVTHNREITVPQDDSVMKYSHLHQLPVIIRRSRGLAPSVLQYQAERPETVLATGALLKSSVTVTHRGNTYTSQYLGHTDSLEAQQVYEETADHLLRLTGAGPQLVVTDGHPQYFSTAYGKRMAENYEVPVIQVQHHKAHAAAVLAEHHLLDSAAPVLCAVWDGTGFGEDGQIWGGEFFKYQHKNLQRCYHFDPFPVLAGDKMAREPRLAALAACSAGWMAGDLLRPKFTDAEWHNYHQLLANEMGLQCTSVGRLFDAVACLLDLCDRQSYEGEAALLLEQLAQAWLQEHGYGATGSYFTEGAHYYRIPTGSLMDGIVMDIRKGCAAGQIAAKFHYSLVHLISIVAKNLGTGIICCSGGVFQNTVIADLLVEHYAGQFQICFHRNLSPNDENISFGQMVYADRGLDGIGRSVEKKV